MTAQNVSATRIGFAHLKLGILVPHEARTRSLELIVSAMTDRPVVAIPLSSPSFTIDISPAFVAILPHRLARSYPESRVRGSCPMPDASPMLASAFRQLS